MIGQNNIENYKRVIPKECWTISVLAICAVLLLINTTSFAQNSSLIGSAVTANNQGRIDLSKVATSTIPDHK